MSCNLTSGYPIQCQDSSPGILKFYVANFTDVTGYTLNATNVVTGLTLSANSFFTFNINRESASYTENINASPVNGTSAYEQILAIYLSKYQTSLRNQIALLVKDRVMVIVSDRNNQYWLLGATTGLNCNGGTGVLGQSYLTDPNGFNLTLQGLEPAPAFEVSSTLISSITS